MVMLPLADSDDVADLWRPLTSDEIDRVTRLIAKASAMLRQRAPWVDDRIRLFQADPTNPAGLDPVTVAAVVATIVKRFVSNPQGVVSESVGPYSMTYTYRGAQDKGVRGEMYVEDSDLDKLKVPEKAGSRIGTVKTRPRMAPWPAGQVGKPYGDVGESASDLWLSDMGGSPDEYPYMDGSPTDPML